MLTLNDGRAELWQWDTGRTLAVDADCSQAHFSNKVFGRSIDVDVVDGTAIIPDILLQTDKDLNVWAFVGTAENGYTKISKTFTVNRRNKPADYVFTPPDQTSLEEIKERLEYLEQNPVESPVQSVNGRTGAVELNAEDVGAISVETDPTVPGWAKQPEKPTYTAAEVGALPDTYTPPVDSTMTKSGQAADAAAVGDRLSALSEEIGTVPENVALLEDVTADEASGDFIPMLSQNGTEYRLSIGDDGVPVIKNANGTTVWSGTSGGSSGGGGTDTTWTSGVPYTLTIIADEYVNETSGAFKTYAGWSRTDYTPCAGAARIVHTGNGYSSPYCAWYDINKNFISSFRISVSSAAIPSEIEVPADAAFFAMSTNSESMNAMTVTPYET